MGIDLGESLKMGGTSKPAWNQQVRARRDARCPTLSIHPSCPPPQACHLLPVAPAMNHGQKDLLRVSSSEPLAAIIIGENPRCLLWGMWGPCRTQGHWVHSGDGVLCIGGSAFKGEVLHKMPPPHPSVDRQAAKLRTLRSPPGGICLLPCTR